jgi:hypothetical protein
MQSLITLGCLVDATGTIWCAHPALALTPDHLVAIHSGEFR